MALTFGFYSLMVAKTGAATTDLMLWIWACIHTVILEGQDGTIDAFMSILSWSFLALYHGKWPTHDWRGVQTLGFSVSYKILFFTLRVAP